MVLYIRVKTHPRKSTDGINGNNKMAKASLFLKDTLWISLVIYHSYWTWWFAVDLPIENGNFPSLCLFTRLVGGLPLSEKYERQLGWLLQIHGKIKVMFQSPPPRLDVRSQFHHSIAPAPPRRPPRAALRHPHRAAAAVPSGRPRQVTLRGRRRWQGDAANQKPKVFHRVYPLVINHL